MLYFLKQASENSYFYFLKFWIYCLLCMNTNIDCFKQVQLFHNYTPKIWLCIGIKKFTLLSNDQRSFPQELHYEFSCQVWFSFDYISPSDINWWWFVQIKWYKVWTKINQSYFDHSHHFHMHYFRSCTQNILIFLIIFRAKCSIFCHSLKI